MDTAEVKQEVKFTAPELYSLSGDLFRPNFFGNYIIERINEKFEGTTLEINKDKLSQEVVKRTTIFTTPAVDQFAREKNARVMTAKECAELYLREQLPSPDQSSYDLGIALDFSGKNRDLALMLVGGLLENKIAKFRDTPLLLNGLEVRKSEAGGYGLAFFVTDYTTATSLPILNEQSGKFSSVDMKTGFPLHMSGGSREFVTNPKEDKVLDNIGLSRVYTNNKKGNIYANQSDLSHPISDGKVFLIKDSED